MSLITMLWVESAFVFVAFPRHTFLLIFDILSYSAGYNKPLECLCSEIEPELSGKI